MDGFFSLIVAIVWTTKVRVWLPSWDRMDGRVYIPLPSVLPHLGIRAERHAAMLWGEDSQPGKAWNPKKDVAF